jgi:hypothetical protein
MVLPLQRGATCSMNWHLADAQFPEVARIVRRSTRDERRDAGRLSGSLRLSGPLGTNFLAEASGSGRLSLCDGYILSLPLFGGLSSHLSLLIPGFGYAEQRNADADFTVRDNGVTIDNGRLLGRLMSIDLRGRYTFDGRFDMRVEVLFLKDGLTAAVTRLVTAPLTKALEFRLSGTMDAPQWRPVNTPTRLLDFFRSGLSRGAGDAPDGTPQAGHSNP